MPSEKKSFWWGTHAICGITLSRMRPGRNAIGVQHVAKLPCGHRFYRKALAVWLTKSAKCPLCRAPVSIAVARRIMI